MIDFSASDVVAWTGGRIANEADLEPGALEKIRFARASVLGSSRSGDIAFFFSKTFQSELPAAQPSVLLTGEDFVKPLAAAGLPFWKKTVVVACRDPYLGMALVTQRLAPGVSAVAHPVRQPSEDAPKIHANAVVDAKARIGRGASIGPGCVVEAGAEVGAGTVLYPNCYVGHDVTIGENCVFFPNVTIYEKVRIGSRVRLHSGVVLGADGFGYAPRKSATGVTGHEKIFHFGSVSIGDDVEIGANTCIDRGTFGDTIVEKMAKIDNHVQIGHNCRIEEGAIICGAAGLAGSARIGRFAYVGGLTGIANQVHVGDAANVGACSLIAKDVPPGEVMLGNPQRSYRDHFRIQARLNKMMSERRGGPSNGKDT